MRKRILLFIFFIASMPLWSYDFTFVTLQEDQIQFKVFSEVLKELYIRLGYTIEVISMPPQRAAEESSKGRVDGEVARIFNFNANCPQLVRIPTPYSSVDTIAFVRKDSGITSVTAAELKNYRVARIRGVLNTNRLTAEVDQVFDFTSIETMMSFISMKRADIALVNRIGGMAALKAMNNHDIIPLESPVAQVKIYHFLNKKFDYIVPQLDSLISSMKESGELEQLIRQTEQRLIFR